MLVLKKVVQKNTIKVFWCLCSYKHIIIIQIYIYISKLTTEELLRTVKRCLKGKKDNLKSLIKLKLHSIFWGSFFKVLFKISEHTNSCTFAQRLRISQTTFVTEWNNWWAAQRWICAVSGRFFFSCRIYFGEVQLSGLGEGNRVFVHIWSHVRTATGSSRRSALPQVSRRCASGWWAPPWGRSPSPALTAPTWPSCPAGEVTATLVAFPSSRRLIWTWAASQAVWPVGPHPGDHRGPLCGPPLQQPAPRSPGTALQLQVDPSRTCRCLRPRGHHHLTSVMKCFIGGISREEKKVWGQKKQKDPEICSRLFKNDRQRTSFMDS